ncbi:MAG: aminoglycoside phosphotransferase family protein [Spirosomaceae bacterium]|nr:aminoglycoside phosphotransferase family protein [Spirosomataceae bacterium]
MQPNIHVILAKFPISGKVTDIKPFGNGLINDTFLVNCASESFILQKVNTAVFTKPETIASNLELAGNYLKEKAPDYLFIKPILTKVHEHYAVVENSFWRLTHFIENSYSIDNIEEPKQAYLAAKAFGNLTKKLDGINVELFEPTIPDFHNLSYRFHQFTQAIDRATEERKAEATNLISNFSSKKNIVTTYEELLSNPQMPTRILHHDTKINNVLFDKKTHEAVAVCDLDTLMPGLIISDIGDMFRTSLSPIAEDSPEYDKIKIREDIYEAICKGYLEKLDDILTETEKKYLNFGGEFMIYMQGIRFLTDYLNGDIYYPVKHPKHNFERATNQWKLLKAFQEFTEGK